MRDFGVGSWAARRARKTPHRTAIVDADGRFSYAVLHERVHRLAHGLRDLGVRRGDRVAYLGPNHHTFLETLFASGVLGAVFVPLNTRLALPERDYCLADSGSTVLVHSPRLGTASDAVRHSIAVGPGDRGSLDYEGLLAEAATAPIDEAVTLEDAAMIMYTSGTTGRPKGALLTHGNLTWNALNVLVDVDLASEEVTLCVTPLFHTAGLNMTCLPTLLKGGTVVLEAAFDPGRVLEHIESHRVTYMFGVPVMFDAIARSDAWATADLSSLRTVFCGGAPVPPAVIAVYLDRGVAFSQGYGMTEASPGVLFLPAADCSRKAGTAGVPHFFTDVRVVDAQARPVAPGQRGEVMVSGPNVMREYWERPGDTDRSFEDGWYRTGDIAAADADGYMSIVDRVKDMYISGGENVYPAEVEKALSEHPDTADCAVIGVPDATWGEVGKAIVVPASAAHASGPELLRFLRGRLAGYKVPKTVEFTAQLPRSPSGKILRRALREGVPMSRRVNGIAEIIALAGADLGRTEWREITQDRVNRFADATDDRQWIHTDPVRAAEGPFGGAIAHGYLTLSLVIPMFGELLEIGGVTASVNYGLNRVRYPAPVRVGDKIRLHAAVVEAEEIKGGAQLSLDLTVEVESGAKPGCVAQAVYRYYA